MAEMVIIVVEPVCQPILAHLHSFHSLAFFFAYYVGVNL